MRNVIFVALISFVAPVCMACECFPARMQAEKARESLSGSEYTIHARVVSADLNGQTTLRVIESFKGPATGSTLVVTSIEHQCGKAKFSVGEEVFVISFGRNLTSCNKYSAEPYLLDAFRKAAAN